MGIFPKWLFSMRYFLFSAVFPRLWLIHDVSFSYKSNTEHITLIIITIYLFGPTRGISIQM